MHKVLSEEHNVSLEKDAVISTQSNALDLRP